MNLIQSLFNYAEALFEICTPARMDGVDCSDDNLQNCKNCLEKVHFAVSGQQSYTCSKMTYLYPLRFLFSYATEIYDTLKSRMEFRSLQNAKMVSVGCGAAPDLCAIEYYITGRKLPYEGFEYVGIDANPYWVPYHEKLVQLCNFATFYTEDILNLSDESRNRVKNCNLLSIQYFFSAVYDKSDPARIDAYFKAICENIVAYMPAGGMIIINDTNSSEMGRPKWEEFFQLVESIRPGATVKRYSYYRNYYFSEYGETITRYSHWPSTMKNPAPIPNYVATPPDKKELYGTHVICGSSQMIISL